MQPLLNTHIVDTFFTISGILTSYVTLSMIGDDRKRFSSVAFIIFRAFRIAPLLYLFILITFLLPLLYSGPLWNETVGSVVNKCYSNWWLNLLFVQNFFNAYQMVR